MAAVPLRQQVMQYVDQLDDEQTLRVIKFIKTLHKSDAPLQNSKTPADEAAARAERDRRDIAWINANAERLNAEVEETLEFQADIWEDEENTARKCSLRGRFASCADPALRAQEKDAWSRAAAEKALSELEGMTFSPKAQTSMDGRAERAQALWRKYESLP